MFGEPLNELALFAGAGGGVLGSVLLGWRTIGAVEISSFCARRLMQRQNERHLPPFPIWDDVCTFDGRPWRGAVDVISGGFPCQDISSAGNGAGLDGSRSGLWREYARIVGEVEPRYVFIENSPLLRTRGLVRVLKDLAALGYDAEWMVLSAKEVGAYHLRKRMWIVATNPQINRRGQGWQRGSVAGGEGQQKQPFQVSAYSLERSTVRSVAPTSQRQMASENDSNNRWWAVEPPVDRVAYGVANGMDRLRALGNGQVPAVAATAWHILSSAIEEGR